MTLSKNLSFLEEETTIMPPFDLVLKGCVMGNLVGVMPHLWECHESFNIKVYFVDTFVMDYTGFTYLIKNQSVGVSFSVHMTFFGFLNIGLTEYLD